MTEPAPQLRYTHRQSFDPQQWLHNLVVDGQWARLKPGEKAVVVALLIHDYHRTGQSRPSVATLAAEAGLSDRRVTSTLQSLVDLQVLALVSPGGGRRAAVYEFSRGGRHETGSSIAAVAASATTAQPTGLAPIQSGNLQGLTPDAHVTPALTPASPHPRHPRHPTPDAHVTPGVTPASPYSKKKEIHTSSSAQPGVRADQPAHEARQRDHLEATLFDDDDAVSLLVERGLGEKDARENYVGRYGAQAVRDAVSDVDYMARTRKVYSYSGLVMSVLRGMRIADGPRGVKARAALNQAARVEKANTPRPSDIARQQAATALARQQEADNLLWSQLDEATRRSHLQQAMAQLPEASRQMHEKFKWDHPANRGLILKQARQAREGGRQG